MQPVQPELLLPEQALQVQLASQREQELQEQEPRLAQELPAWAWRQEPERLEQERPARARQEPEQEYWLQAIQEAAAVQEQEPPNRSSASLCGL